MAIQRRRFRIEENQSGGMPVLDEVETSVPVAGQDASSSHHREVMSELRAIRAQMATPRRAPKSNATKAGDEPVTTEQLADAKKLLDTYRAQIEQCEKLKVELDLIHDAINRTKQEIAVLHGGSFSGDEMAKVTGELGAVVGGTEEATQQILAAAEAIDQAASAMTKMTSPDQQAQLSEDILERVVAIFEACNFQDLTGQRISKVMTTMKFIEHHINEMMEIWGGVDAIKAHAPAIIDTRVGDARLLNGPKGLNDEGHVSQDDIDALFD